MESRPRLLIRANGADDAQQLVYHTPRLVQGQALRAARKPRTATRGKTWGRDKEGGEAARALKPDGSQIPLYRALLAVSFGFDDGLQNGLTSRRAGTDIQIDGRGRRAIALGSAIMRPEDPEGELLP